MTGIGFIGAGNHGRHHIKEFSRLPGVRLTRVFDLSPESSGKAALDFPGLIAASSLSELLSDDTTQGLVIATPAETHLELVEFALTAGKHILLEKPMAASPQHAQKIVQLSQAFPHLVVLVGHCERFNSAYIDAKKAISEGHLGEPRFISASRISPLHLNDPNWASVCWTPPCMILTSSSG